MGNPKKNTTVVALIHLERRVTSLEEDVSVMRAGFGSLTTEVAALRATVKQVDERTHRGEVVLLDVQLEQRRMARAIARIADHLKVPPGKKEKKK